MTIMTLRPGLTSLDALETIYREQCAVKLDRSAKAAVQSAAAQITNAVNGGDAVYGVNTGFGKLASVKKLLKIRPHCSVILFCRIAAALAKRPSLK